MDIGPSVLDLFGVAVPEYMRGRSVFSRAGDESGGGAAKGQGAGGGG